jgi:hypothetical protein
MPRCDKMRIWLDMIRFRYDKMSETLAFSPPVQLVPKLQALESWNFASIVQARVSGRLRPKVEIGAPKGLAYPRSKRQS